MAEESITNDANSFFSGIWFCYYWYPSTKHPGQDISEHYVKIHQKGHTLIFESIPNIEESYLLIRLTLDDDLATGVWQENTSPTGPYKGALYEGAVQFIVDKEKKRMDGIGVGPTLVGGKKVIISTKWEIRHIGQEKVPVSKNKDPID